MSHHHQQHQHQRQRHHQQQYEQRRVLSYLPKWPLAMIESSGDYRTESHLEDIIGGPLYAHQSSLPRLPLPSSLEETIDRLIPTALPLAQTSQESQQFLKACHAFPQQASSLQHRLEERMVGEMKDSSWLQYWWNTMGYLQVRDSVMINVSYFFHFSDDPTLSPPPSPSTNGTTTTTTRGIQRAASILFQTAEFRKRVCSGMLPAESIGRREPKTPLCSTAFKYMFHACRIPRRIEDTYRIYDPSNHTHCIVVSKGQFFSLDFIHPHTGNALPLSVIERRLQHCVHRANKNSSSSSSLLLGYLTSNDRDSWADAREELLRVGGKSMEHALETLESGALLLCLDDTSPVSRKQCAEMLLYAGSSSSSSSSGFNRWFDKSIQIICSKNGKAGFLGEHSMMDGMPLIGYADHITKYTYRDSMNQSLDQTNHPPPPPDGDDDGVKNIFEDLEEVLLSESSKVPSMIAQAKDAYIEFTDKHEIRVQAFHGYGSTEIKRMKFSPDAYVQMAMQLATYRLFGHQAGTYEASQMRPYLHGRTETTRTVSPSSSTFIQQMGFIPQWYNTNNNTEEEEEKREEKLQLLRMACGNHVDSTKKASRGDGVDRHLFGLSMLVNENENCPDLFSDPLFLRSKRWRVSTSHLTHPNFDNWGYGEVVPDGVGLAYAVKPDKLIFNITALKEHDWTERLSHLLEEALLEMQSLSNMVETPPQSKL